MKYDKVDYAHSSEQDRAGFEERVGELSRAYQVAQYTFRTVYALGVQPESRTQPNNTAAAANAYVALSRANPEIMTNLSTAAPTPEQATSSAATGSVENSDFYLEAKRLVQEALEAAESTRLEDFR
jgi:hypothetical protein